ncbi:hypothetical protein SDJN02_13856, partial [Cucurbita argyrosperma subsp. argyrosperma]
MAFTEDSCSRQGSQPYSLNLSMPGFSCYVKSLSGTTVNQFHPHNENNRLKLQRIFLRFRNKDVFGHVANQIALVTEKTKGVDAMIEKWG